MDFLEYKGYKGSVEYSKEDNCLFGAVVAATGTTINDFINKAIKNELKHAAAL